MNTPPKQQTAFPEVGILRKGGPKEKGKSKDGREIEVMGKDLNDRFRSVFHPGTADIQKRFFDVYQTYTPATVQAMMPFRSVWRNWTCFYEAHQGGCMLAKADDERVISLRHPATKEYIIRNGQPAMPFTPGTPLEYNGQAIKLKPVGRLRLFLPKMRRFVTFLLKTTSFYDRLNVEQNLAAIQAVADVINSGNAAGIPFLVYRRQTEITWKQSRIHKWLVYLEIDAESDWGQQAMERLLKAGLPTTWTPTPTLSVPDEAAPDLTEDDSDDEFEDEAGMVEPGQAQASQPTLPLPIARPYLDKSQVDTHNPAEVTASIVRFLSGRGENGDGASGSYTPVETSYAGEGDNIPF
jgi:hypothetical protein